MKPLVIALYFALWFFGCADGAPMPEETCIGNIASQQARTIAQECASRNGFLFTDPCINKVARERILIAIEYAKLCQ